MKSIDIHPARLLNIMNTLKDKSKRLLKRNGISKCTKNDNQSYETLRGNNF